MADQSNASRTNRLLAILLGLAVIAVGVLGYLYYQEKRKVVRIDVPGFSGSISKEPGGFSGKIGKDKEINVQVD
jgi:hypothetical protein